MPFHGIVPKRKSGCYLSFIPAGSGWKIKKKKYFSCFFQPKNLLKRDGFTAGLKNIGHNREKKFREIRRIKLSFLIRLSFHLPMRLFSRQQVLDNRKMRW
jgi:hypothetical protein